jgi:hypothetical protein
MDRFSGMDDLTLLYLVNSVLLIVHEIDSAYWREWELFRLPGGLDGFLLLHIPLVGLILFGLLELAAGTNMGALMYFIVDFGGFFAFSVHTYFLRKGDERFRGRVSQILLYLILLVSVIQLLVIVPKRI